MAPDPTAKFSIDWNFLAVQLLPENWRYRRSENLGRHAMRGRRERVTV
jgi:hypothetical protein